MATVNHNMVHTEVAKPSEVAKPPEDLCPAEEELLWNAVEQLKYCNTVGRTTLTTMEAICAVKHSNSHW